MYTYTTDTHRIFHREEVSFYRNDRAEMELVVCRPDRVYQRIAGFGGAFTEAGAYVFAQMSEEVQDRFLQLCFGSGDAGGNAYNLCRTHIQSCDFALGNYAYVRRHDKKLSSFSIKRDQQLLLPFIQCGLALNPHLELLATPWSPPGFMKSNHMMNAGGRLKPSYYAAWAQLLVRYLQAYEQEGVIIGRMSVQNEPMARQTWDSCLFTAEEEADFAVNHMRPALDAAGLEAVKLFAWDHNTDCLLDRMERTFAYPGAEEAFDGVAFHWYAGDHFEQVAAVADDHPNKELLFTEGCVEYSLDQMAHATQERKAEQYAHTVMGDLNAGAQGFIDWNLLLDERGGPNHVGNFCEAPLMYDRGKAELVVNRSFYYLGHFSRFIQPGARRFMVSRFTDAVACVGFVNLDQSRVLVVLNRTDCPVSFDVAERPLVARLEVPAHGIVSATWSVDEVEH